MKDPHQTQDGQPYTVTSYGESLKIRNINHFTCFHGV